MILKIALYTFFAFIFFFVEGLPSREAYPHVIAHRGASGYVPEHSLEAYQLAIDLLADYIEPDLCLSKDGIFVALHDVLLDDTTNVASLPQFEGRDSTKIVDGEPKTGYFVSDFTFAELQEMRLKQRMQGRSTLYDGLFQIPSFTSIMSLAHQSYNSTGRVVGIYVELKNPRFFHSLGFQMEDMLLSALAEGGYSVQGDQVERNLSQVVPVVIQCFNPPSLQYIHSKSSLPLVQLTEAQDSTYWTEEAVKTIASYAQAVGPDKSFLGSLSWSAGQDLVALIHSAGLLIHPYTFRADSGVLTKFDGDFEKEEMYFYCCLGGWQNIMSHYYISISCTLSHPPSLPTARYGWPFHRVP